MYVDAYYSGTLTTSFVVEKQQQQQQRFVTAELSGQLSPWLSIFLASYFEFKHRRHQFQPLLLPRIDSI